MKVLNLYAEIGGNRKLWQGCEVTAIEIDKAIAAAYHGFFPGDIMIVGDAHTYLIDNYLHFDFIWSSPPCQSHSRFILSGRNQSPRYPDMGIYQEIIFLQTYSTGLWVVENVVPHYKPLIDPSFKIGRHLFWSNFPVDVCGTQGWEHGPVFKKRITELQYWLGIHSNVSIYYNGNHDPRQVYRNCVHPDVGLHIYNAALKDLGKQEIESTRPDLKKQLELF